MSARPELAADDGRRTRWAGQQQRRRAEFTDAALAAIARHGPEVSTEQIADEAGVARTRVYKHFSGAGDLQRAVAQRTVELLAAELEPMWNPHGSPQTLVATAVDALTAWLADNQHLYHYLRRHSLSGTPGDPDAVTDVKAAIAVHLGRLLGSYLAGFGADTRVAEPLAFGLVALVESATHRWLEHPTDMTREELNHHLAGWTWRLLEDTLRSGGVALDPDEPLAAQLATTPRTAAQPLSARCSEAQRPGPREAP